MSISTVSTNSEDKREKLKRLREYHQSTLNSLGVPDAVFIPKMAYRPYGKTELHIGFFESEVSKGEDIYVEFTSKDLTPEDPERKLYKWRFNPHYSDEYEKTEPSPQNGHFRYLVPVEELSMIASSKLIAGESTKNLGEQAKLDFSDIPDPEDDLPMDQMTIRDYAAIHMRRPVSKKEWLNKIITNFNS